MQLTRSLLLLCLSVSAITAAAQRKNALLDHNNVIKINFNSDIVEGGIPLAWEFKTNQKQSLQLAITFTYSKNDDRSVSGIGFNPEYRFYLSKNKPGISGVYAGPFAAVNFLTYKDKYYNGTNATVKYNITALGGGVIFGHQWAWQSGFALDLNLGLGLKTLSYKNKPANNNYYYDDDFAEGFIPRLGVAIGYAF